MSDTPGAPSAAVPLEAEGLACAVAGRTILAGVDLVVAPGELVAVVGVNGVGKSTLLRTLAGLLPVVGGRARIAGRDVAGLGARDRARLIAFVAQEEQPPADMRVADYVALGRLPYRPPWARGHDDRDTAVAALDRVGLAEAADRACSDLSGGERRRVSLARGLAQDCELLVLDEPTNHLDVRHQVALLGLLRDAGRAVVTAIHDLGLAAAHFDRVVVLDAGRVRVVGPPTQVLTPDVVAEVFGVRSVSLSEPDGRRHLVVGEGRPATDPDTDPAACGPPAADDQPDPTLT